MTEATVTPSSGNVFADLGIPDAEEHLLKAKLALAIVSIMRQRGLNQLELSRVLGTNPVAVCRIVRGRLKQVSVKQLITFLSLLDHDVDVVVRKRQEAT